MPAATARDELPRLDLLRSFAVAARTLSFTQAAHELALTQSAVSRQIQQMEEGLGVALFERRHRALALTPAGETMARAVHDCLERLRDATASVRASQRARQVAVTTTPGFASLWLIPRLARFSADHPQVDVLVSATNDLLNLERSQIDVAVRFCAIGAGQGAPLFEETVLPVCAPRLLQDAARPLRQPADLARHTLLVMEAHHGMPPMADWAPWLEVMGLSGLRGTNTLRFSNYNDAVAAALAGQGVAIGRLPLVAALLRDGQLVTPFGGSGQSQRGYFVAASPQAAANADAQDFIAWLHAEALLPW
ncbi:LysR substrate-binding domain-containing protein [Pseudorhodoferax sp. Leaf267]|uniref:LysR substrate-binding domain-containing protein n=1 Tax=Pseudorhodoferax sp. Leaf267 TaxID=1736316 RepID=UPI001F3329E7|nr:LysR substrate-binding domain-containing protein [Pseudorhodoferax sp. Leaf267]